jgi:GT2 family glycosyltransferase
LDNPESMPAASVVIPTRARAAYLEVTLGSLMPQAAAAGAEVIVVSDGADPATARTAAAHGARLVELDPPGGLNGARNTGVRTASAELVAFIDDDVETPPGWLRALLDGVAASDRHEVFGGPIRARLEGGGPRACGREPAPITHLDFGDADRDVAHVWGANMAIRTSAFARLGPFDERLAGRGDEEEWLRRYVAAGGRIRYVAAAGLIHRRSAQDATLRALSRAAYALGRTARRNDVRKHTTPRLIAELRVLAGCMWHTVRRRCAYGIVMFAHEAGRLREALNER